MSRPVAVPTSENSPQRPSKSAWARGPPKKSAATTPSRAQSPAPPTPVSVANPVHFGATHSRPSSVLSQVSANDGVNDHRSAVKQGSAVTFGSIESAPVSISSWPAPAPAAELFAGHSTQSPKKKKKKRLILIESQEQKEKRLAEEKASEGPSEESNKTSEYFLKVNEDAPRRQIEQREIRMVDDRELKEVAECTSWEEEERKEAEERAARKTREAEEREEEHLSPEWVRAQREATSDAQPDPLQEEGKNEDEADLVRQTNTAEVTLPNKTASVTPPASSERLRIGTTLPSPGHPRKRPEPLNFQTTITSNSAHTLSPALATMRHIEDINLISYPEGIKRPKVELNVNTQKGEFRYDRDFLLQFMNICKERPDNLPLLDMTGKRPGPRNLQTTIANNSAPALLSALDRLVEEFERDPNPEGIKTLKVESNTQKGKLRAITATVVPIESLLSDPYAKSPFTPKGTGSGDSETPDGSRQQSVESFLRHAKYFFSDGNITFLVNGFLYCVHRYLFSHGSQYFSARFAQLDIRDHEALSTIVSLGDVECEDFEAFLSVLYPDFEEHDLSYEQWRSVLHLSTRWGFASRRRSALESIKPPTPYDRLLLARTYAVDHWVVPALAALCERTAPLSLDEARGMNIEDVVLVFTVREDVLRFGVSAVEIPRRVEAMQAGRPISPVGKEVSPASPTSGSTVNANVDSDSKARSCGGTETVVTEPVNGKTPTSGGSLAEATTISQGEKIEQLDGEQHSQTTKVISNNEQDALPLKVKKKKGKKGKVKSDEAQHYRTTEVALNDDLSVLPSDNRSPHPSDNWSTRPSDDQGIPPSDDWGIPPSDDWSIPPSDNWGSIPHPEGWDIPPPDDWGILPQKKKRVRSKRTNGNPAGLQREHQTMSGTSSPIQRTKGKK